MDEKSIRLGGTYEAKIKLEDKSQWVRVVVLGYAPGKRVRWTVRLADAPPGMAFGGRLPMPVSASALRPVKG